jgi:predicted ATPase
LRLEAGALLSQAPGVIAEISFRNFKALRSTRLALGPFNLIIGPNGSGKTSLIEALDRLRALARLPGASGAKARRDGPEIEFYFAPPHDGIRARLGCVSETVCDLLDVEPGNAAGWPALRDELVRIRRFFLDHEAMAVPSLRQDGSELRADGGNLAAYFAGLRERAPEAFTGLTAELLRILPEFRSVELVEHPDDRVELGLRLEEDGVVPATELSQGVLYLLGVLGLAYDPTPPSVLCIEEPDRGIHPRMLREIRDLLYRLSYPASSGLQRPAVQVVATTHSPYFIDLFRDHPEEVVISHKHGRAARFERLSDRPDLPELLREGSLGEMWFSGILGGVPEE